jgi:DNA-directed RNA polymerase subunit M/transcription elongation factor TFIIS
MLGKQICPKCKGLLVVKTDQHDCGGYKIYSVACSTCGLKDKAAMTDTFALASFYNKHGPRPDQLISLLEIQQDGGPPIKTMLWRISNGYYPDAKTEKHVWKLPLKTAEKAVEEWKQRKTTSATVQYRF